MMELLSESQGGFLSVRIAGLVTDEDFQAIAPEFERAIAATDKPINGLIDWSELEGWDDAAAADTFMLRIKVRSRIRRVAILADAKWRDEVASLADIISEAEVRQFPTSARESALAWLQEP